MTSLYKDHKSKNLQVWNEEFLVSNSKNRLV